MSNAEIRKLASAVSTAMFSLLYEGNYPARNGPGEDEIYAVALRAISQALKQSEKRK
jgi:hypothetical protein